jgi:hypothetical protein
MDVSFIILLLIMAGVTSWLVLQARRRNQKEKKKDSLQTRLERAVWAWARILTCTVDEGVAQNPKKVHLELEVHMPGSPAYTTRTTWLVEKEGMDFIQAGKEISVKADPQEPAYLFPNGPWARRVEK